MLLTDPELQEIAHGEWEGLLASEIQEKDPARLLAWRGAVAAAAALPAGPTIATLRAALRDDLNAPQALAAVDAWAAASSAIDGDDVDAPADIAQALDALLGVRL